MNTQANTQHTPTPWFVHQYYTPDKYVLYSIGSEPRAQRGDFSAIALSLQNEANAALIVKAVNNHDALVRALNAMVIVSEGKNIEPLVADVAIEYARAVLAEVQKGTP